MVQIAVDVYTLANAAPDELTIVLLYDRDRIIEEGELDRRRTEL